MEEKVYSRSVTKQAMSGRVVDKLQIDRHYRVNELSELYTLTKTDETKRTQPQISKDSVLNYLLQNYPGQAFRYHIHDSLLENKPEQDLNEDDIKEAWAIYESELQGRPLMNGLNQPNNDLMRTDMVRSHIDYFIYFKTLSIINHFSFRAIISRLWPIPRQVCSTRSSLQEATFRTTISQI